MPPPPMPARPLSPADGGAPDRTYKLPVNGLRLNVVEWGDPLASPVVLLHGLREAAWTFRTVAQALRHRHRVIAIDQRGRGASDWDPTCNYYTDAYVGDLLGVVDAIGLAAFDLLGHSMGGAVAIVFAATHPDRVRRLVIEDAGPGAFESSPTAVRLREQLSSAPISFASSDAALTYLRGMKRGQSEEQLRERLQGMLVPAHADDSWTWRHDHAGIARVRLAPDPARAVDLRRHVQALRCPTLLLRGGESDYLLADTARSMLACNPRIACEELAGAGHYVHEDAPQAYIAAVSRFLEPLADHNHNHNQERSP